MAAPVMRRLPARWRGTSAAAARIRASWPRSAARLASPEVRADERETNTRQLAGGGAVRAARDRPGLLRAEPARVPAGAWRRHPDHPLPGWGGRAGVRPR